MSNYPKSNQDYDSDTAVANKPGLSGLPDTAGAAISKAASSAHGAIKSTQDAAASALDSLEGKVGEAAPALHRMATKLDSAARSGVKTVKEAQDKAYKQARAAKDAAVGYVQREPGKGLMISAAVGAVFMMVLSWSRRSRSEDESSRYARSRNKG